MGDEQKVTKRIECSCGKRIKVRLPREKMEAGMKGTCPRCDRIFRVQSDLDDPSESSAREQKEQNSDQVSEEGDDFQLEDPPDSARSTPSSSTGSSSPSSSDTSSKSPGTRRRKANTYQRSSTGSGLTEWLTGTIGKSFFLLLFVLGAGTFTYYYFGFSRLDIASIPSILPADTAFYFQLDGVNQISDQLDQADFLKDPKSTKDQLKNMKYEKLPEQISTQFQVSKRLSEGMVRSLKEMHIAVLDVKKTSNRDRRRRSGSGRKQSGFASVLDSATVFLFLRLDTEKFLTFLRKAELKLGENDQTSLFQNKEEYRGIPVYTLEEAEQNVQVARMGEWVVLARNQERIEKLLDHVKEGLENPLSKDENFMTAKKEMATDNGFWVYSGSSLFSDVYDYGQAKTGSSGEGWEDSLEKNTRFIKNITFAGVSMGDDTKGMVQFQDKIPKKFHFRSFQKNSLSLLPKTTLGFLATGTSASMKEEIKSTIGKVKETDQLTRNLQQFVEQLGHQGIVFLSRKPKNRGKKKRMMPVNAGGVLNFQDAERAYKMIPDIVHNTKFLGIEEKQKSNRHYYEVSRKKTKRPQRKQPKDLQAVQPGKRKERNRPRAGSAVPDTQFVGRKDDDLMITTSRNLLFSLLDSNTSNIQYNAGFNQLSFSSDAFSHGVIHLSEIASLSNQEKSGIFQDETWLSVSFTNHNNRSLLSSSVSWTDVMGLIFSGIHQYQKTRNRSRQQ